MFTCIASIVFIELNFIAAFLLVRKTWDDRFAGKVGGRGWGILVMGGDCEMGRGVDTPLRAILIILIRSGTDKL